MHRAAAIVVVVATLAVPGQAWAQSCPRGNLARDATVTGEEYRGALGIVVDGQRAQEAAAWDSPRALVSASNTAWLTIDLGSSRTLRALALQADQNDTYLVEGSRDGVDWRRLWLVPIASVEGLRTRAARLSTPAEARFLRVRIQRGDGRYALSELAAYCEVPDVWPPREVDLGLPAPSPWTRSRVNRVKLGVAVAAVALFVWGLWLRRVGRAQRQRRLRDGILVVLGLTAGLCWWNLGKFHFDEYLHTWEHFHYYVGTKYYPELGHTRLYECTTVADLEDGLERSVADRRIRNLETNFLESTTALTAEPGRCRERFTDARWEAFKQDVAWFRGETFAFRWEALFRDHGYNATPVWGLVGSALAGIAPASRATISALGLVDPLLLLVMWVVVYRTFGLRVCAVALLWWGTNLLSDYAWTGGAFLRQDWLVLSVAGICLARQGRMASSGFLLTWATLLRVFPGFIVGALVLQAAHGMWRRKSFTLQMPHRRFAAGCVAGIVLLVGATLLVPGGAAAWGQFIENTRANIGSTGTNTVGLMTAISYEPANTVEALLDTAAVDPSADWLTAKCRVFESRRPFYWLLVLAFLVCFARAVRDEDDWVVLALGIGLIPILAFPSCYYFSIFAGYGLLYERYREQAGLPVAALSAATLLAGILRPVPIHYDQRFAAISVAVVATVIWITWTAWRDSVAGRR